MFYCQRITSSLHVRLTLLALLVCALACRVPGAVGAQALRSSTAIHRLEGDFLRFWEQNDGARRLGPPLSAAIWLDGRLTQLFARALLERRADGAPGVDDVA